MQWAIYILGVCRGTRAKRGAGECAESGTPHRLSWADRRSEKEEAAATRPAAPKTCTLGGRELRSRLFARYDVVIMMMIALREGFKLGQRDNDV